MAETDLAPMVINCIHAGRITQNEYRFYECNNSEGAFAHKAVCQAYCTRCKYRVPIKRDDAPIMDHKPELHQTTVTEWLGGD